MRIAFVVPRFHTNLFFATRALIAAGHDVSILTAGAGHLEDHRHVAPTILGHNPRFSEVRAALDEAAPDLLLIRNCGRLSTKAAWYAKTMRRTRRYGYSLRPYHKAAPLRLSERLRAVPHNRVTPVLGDRARAADPRATYLPWPTGRLPGIAPRVARTDGSLRILAVGKFQLERKNLDAVCDVLIELGADRSARLTLVGSQPADADTKEYAPLKRIMTFAKDHEWIEARPNQTFEAMGRLYASHDVCILPSYDEPLGIAPIEAMPYGAIPVISSQAGSAGYIRHGETGLVVDPADRTSLTSAMRRLIEEPDFRLRLSRAALAEAESTYSEARFVQSVEALI